MKVYLDLLHDVVTNGISSTNRTGIPSQSLTGRSLRWNLSDGFPIVTTRKVSFKIAFEETMFFLRGETHTKTLEEKGIGIWKENTSRQFLDSVGLTNLDEGDMGKGYGYQIRNFGGSGYDQLDTLLSGLKKDPTGRRHVISHWCPYQLSDVTLPPCHLMHMYSVKNDKLDSSFVMRSSDVYHGLPYNIMSYALMNNIFSKYLGINPGELVYFGHDVHVYEPHIKVINQQLIRHPYPLPRLVINKNLQTLQDILDLKISDCILDGYESHPALQKVAMAI